MTPLIAALVMVAVVTFAAVTAAVVKAMSTDTVAAVNVQAGPQCEAAAAAGMMTVMLLMKTM